VWCSFGGVEGDRVDVVGCGAVWLGGADIGTVRRSGAELPGPAAASAATAEKATTPAVPLAAHSMRRRRRMNAPR
jgi:hypothetical protein